MLALRVDDLSKKYDKFYLKNVSFQLEKGYIMGFIGSNGAGKTTTLKAILNMIRADNGEIQVFGKRFEDYEISLKQDIGYAFGGIDFYQKSKIKKITKVVKRFYTNWNESTYLTYLKRFNLDPDKRISELSEGMRVKYSLTLALSHDAKLFILDEPTSGLDPVARDGLLEIFQELVEEGERSILFSTHITSDLEKCADYITYINNGEIVGSNTMTEFIESYRLISGSSNVLSKYKKEMIAYKENSFGFTGLTAWDKELDDDIEQRLPNLEEIMIFYAKKEELHESFTI